MRRSVGFAVWSTRSTSFSVFGGWVKGGSSRLASCDGVTCDGRGGEAAGGEADLATFAFFFLAPTVANAKNDGIDRCRDDSTSPCLGFAISPCFFVLKQWRWLWHGCLDNDTNYIKSCWARRSEKWTTTPPTKCKWHFLVESASEWYVCSVDNEV